MCVKKNNIFKETIILILIFICLFSTFTFTQAPENETSIKVAVINFKGLNIDQTDAIIISNLFRNKLSETGKFILIDKAMIDNALTIANYTSNIICDVECAVNIGKTLSADKVINGEISRLGDAYIFSLRMIDVAESKLQITETIEKKCYLEDLAMEMPGIVSQFMEKYSKISGENVQALTPVALPSAESQPTGKGKIRFTITPNGATVMIDDKLLGISPIPEKELEEGVYKITVDKYGYEPQTISVTVSRGKAEEVNISLKTLDAQRKSADNKIKLNESEEKLLPMPVDYLYGLYFDVMGGYFALTGEDFDGKHLVEGIGEQVYLPLTDPSIGFSFDIGYSSNGFSMELMFETTTFASSFLDMINSDSTLTSFSIRGLGSLAPQSKFQVLFGGYIGYTTLEFENGSIGGVPVHSGNAKYNGYSIGFIMQFLGQISKNIAVTAEFDYGQFYVYSATGVQNQTIDLEVEGILSSEIDWLMQCRAGIRIYL